MLLRIYILLMVCFTATAFMSFYTLKDKTELKQEGIFSCTINDKPFVLNNMKAEMRTVTGGRKQLSISNDRFTSFFFINPEPREFLLSASQNREAIIRYTNPHNLNLYLPENGLIKITTLDIASKILVGEFEMDLVPKNKIGKKIKISNGKLINIPIILK